MIRAILTCLLVFIGFSGLVLAQSQHNDIDAQPCNDCHIVTASGKVVLKDTSIQVCLGCHPMKDMKLTHPLGIKVNNAPPDLPLSKSGRLLCATCHSFHKSYTDFLGKKHYLRRGVFRSNLCLSCHREGVFTKIIHEGG